MTLETMNASTRAAVEAVAALDERRIAATVAADVDALRGILADDLVWTHANGNSDSKSEWIEKVGSGKVRYHSFAFEEKRFRAFDATVVINGKGTTSVYHHGGVDTFRMSITAVYANRGGGWQMVAMQVTKMP
jgi:ketosteroid isomerase-like protein